MLNRILIFAVSFFVFILPDNVLGQDKPIVLKNPSFEDVPHVGGELYNRAPKGWYDCGQANETPPDIQPNLDPFKEPFFGVTTKAYDGETYLGMVVRDNDTYEGVGQRLPQGGALEPGQCYEMSMHLARSDTYVSLGRSEGNEGKPMNYTEPIKIRIYGANGYCGKTEMLAETELAKNTIWKKNKLRFEPTQRHRFILIQAFYKTPTLLPYNGNVLVDNLSDIVPVPCDDNAPVNEPDEPLASIDNIPPSTKVNVKPPKKNPEPTPKPKTEPKVEKPDVIPPSYNNPPEKPKLKPKKEKTIKALDRKRIWRGQVIQISKLYFEIDQSQINEDSYKVLDEIYDFLVKHDDVHIELRGHTNSNCEEAFCNDLSKARAKAVADYLFNKGISAQRLTYQGYGKKKPLASNNYAAGRRKGYF